MGSLTALAAAATVALTNEAPDQGRRRRHGSPLPPAVPPPPGTNRKYLSVYSPWDLDATRLDEGSRVNVERARSLAYPLFLDIRRRAGTRTIKLDLRGSSTPKRPTPSTTTMQPFAVRAGRAGAGCRGRGQRHDNVDGLLLGDGVGNGQAAA